MISAQAASFFLRILSLLKNKVNSGLVVVTQKNIFAASLGQHYVAAWSDPLDRPAARPAYHDDLGQTDQ